MADKSKSKRRSLAEALKPEERIEITPEMEAFRKGDNPTPVAEIESKAVDFSKETKKKRHLGVMLDSALYDEFSHTCYQRKTKMMVVLRELIEDYVRKNS